MPTASQFKILSKIGLTTEGRASSARHHALQQAAERANALPTPVYLPPVRRVFSLGAREMERLGAVGPGSESSSYFPEMVSMAMLVSRPGVAVDDMTADQIMARLHELGWRKEGEAGRLIEERRRREEERLRQEEEQAARRREALDLINDPILRRVKEKNQSVPKYSKAPDSRPLAICFDVLGPSLAHSTVKMKLDQLLFEMDEVNDIKMVSLEFQPRAMHIKGKNVGNRWVITLDTHFAVTRLDGRTLTFGKQQVELHPYDSVIGTEYQTFTRQNNFMKILE